jgi:hypothetical protein
MEAAMLEQIDQFRGTFHPSFSWIDRAKLS